MNIGLDIDNVITAFDDTILKEFLKEDKNKRNTGIIDKRARHIVHGMFDWSQEEVDEFFAKNMEFLASKLKVRKNCKKYMDKLLKDGHKLFLISHRAYPHYNNPEKTTLDWLAKHKINYSELILSESPDKTKECLANNIDVMVDDRAVQCKKMRANGVNCILMLTKYNKYEKDDLMYATSWKNLYEEITQWKKDI